MKPEGSVWIVSEFSSRVNPGLGFAKAGEGSVGERGKMPVPLGRKVVWWFPKPGDHSLPSLNVDCSEGPWFFRWGRRGESGNGLLLITSGGRIIRTNQCWKFSED